MFPSIRKHASSYPTQSPSFASGSTTKYLTISLAAALLVLTSCGEDETTKTTKTLQNRPPVTSQQPQNPAQTVQQPAPSAPGLSQAQMQKMITDGVSTGVNAGLADVRNTIRDLRDDLDAVNRDIKETVDDAVQDVMAEETKKRIAANREISKKIIESDQRTQAQLNAMNKQIHERDSLLQGLAEILEEDYDNDTQDNTVNTQQSSQGQMNTTDSLDTTPIDALKLTYETMLVDTVAVLTGTIRLLQTEKDSLYAVVEGKDSIIFDLTALNKAQKDTIIALTEETNTLKKQINNLNIQIKTTEEAKTDMIRQVEILQQRGDLTDDEKRKQIKAFTLLVRAFEQEKEILINNLGVKQREFNKIIKSEDKLNQGT